MNGTDTPALRIGGLRAGYGHGDVLCGVDIVARTGTITAVVGPNGAGKSTLMKVLAGIHDRPVRGTVEVFGVDRTRDSARDRLAAGLSLCPERRRVFPAMSIEENLLMGAVTLSPSLARRRVRETYERVPWLAERRRTMAGNLSGGQQQLLAICRAIMTDPPLLLLDEPSLGLSPKVVGEVADLIRTLGEEGRSVLIVEQNVALGLRLASEVYVLNQGVVVEHGPASALADDDRLMATYLG
ncbi:ABC transporter ATP-binding protein [Streptomyces antioxidans]|uniref:ABC transporter ATP-binding protein n=1 Tax=Streptomyces antioxidans TaxID=1507734 RepID=A0A1V4D1I1_9ACTN|nr:ABC transporter ATP-binding protein [Streptomyces antioxidans]OPF76918.1 ABC transporter ATP-binding protein [Streptomyces antioxidans]